MAKKAVKKRTTKKAARKRRVKKVGPQDGPGQVVAEENGEPLVGIPSIDSITSSIVKLDQRIDAAKAERGNLYEDVDREMAGDGIESYKSRYGREYQRTTSSKLVVKKTTPIKG